VIERHQEGWVCNPLMTGPTTRWPDDLNGDPTTNVMWPAGP